MVSFPALVNGFWQNKQRVGSSLLPFYFDCVLVLTGCKLFCKQSFRWMESNGKE
jgi:hypothetical protein